MTYITNKQILVVVADLRFDLADLVWDIVLQISVATEFICYRKSSNSVPCTFHVSKCKVITSKHCNMCGQ